MRRVQMPWPETLEPKPSYLLALQRLSDSLHDDTRRSPDINETDDIARELRIEATYALSVECKIGGRKDILVNEFEQLAIHDRPQRLHHVVDECRFVAVGAVQKADRRI